MSAILETLLLLFFGFTSLLLICVVIIQKGRGGGLASAFGGGSGTATAFGSKTGDVLTWATSVIFGVFLLIAIILNLIANYKTKPVFVAPLTPIGMTPPAASAAIPPTTLPAPEAPAAPATQP